MRLLKVKEEKEKIERERERLLKIVIERKARIEKEKRLAK